VVHSTKFDGRALVRPSLNEVEVSYLKHFAATDHEDGPTRHCRWEPTDDGRALVWDGSDDPEHGAAWLRYLINHFLKPYAHRSRLPEFSEFTFDHNLNGAFQPPGAATGGPRLIMIDDNEVLLR
jgi:hypothetical protein